MSSRTSVIVPTFNRAFKLIRALKSLEDQHLKDFIVLISDDGSEDSTPQVISSFEKSLEIEVITGPNSGRPGVARNRALDRVRTEYVAFLDSDDWWTPDKLMVSVQALDHGADLVYHDLRKVGGEYRYARSRNARSRQLRGSIPDALIRRGNVIPNSSVVVRTEWVQLAGGFSNELELVSWEDFDLWIRIAEQGAIFRRIPGVHGFYEADSGISGGERYLFALEQFRKRYVVARNLSSPGWLDFAVGSTYFRAGCFRDAAPHLLRSLVKPRTARFAVDLPKALLGSAVSLAMSPRGPAERD